MPDRDADRLATLEARLAAAEARIAALEGGGVPVPGSARGLPFPWCHRCLLIRREPCDREDCPPGPRFGAAHVVTRFLDGTLPPINDKGDRHG